MRSYTKAMEIPIQGESIPPPIKNFKDMRIPEPIFKKLKDKGIVQPTPILVHPAASIFRKAPNNTCQYPILHINFVHIETRGYPFCMLSC